jgi:hypothetical protein
VPDAVRALHEAFSAELDLAQRGAAHV